MDHLGDRIASAALETAQDALLAAGRIVLAEAIRNVPVGDPKEDPDAHITLARSGEVEIVHNRFGDLVRVSFDTPYAARQHENLRLAHPRGGGPKYLERALTTVMPRLPNIVAASVDAETATGRISDPRRSHKRRVRR